MFNLDQAIVEWRRQMLAAGIKSVETLDELEGHLREEVEQRIRRGIVELKAFEFAVQQMGEVSLLKKEFDKDNQTKIMKRTLIISAGIIGVLVGMALVMPAVAQYRDTGAMSHDEPELFLIGSFLTLAGTGAGIIGMTTRRA